MIPYKDEALKMAKQLRIKSSMILGGEKIAPFSECYLMEQVADYLEALEQQAPEVQQEPVAWMEVDEIGQSKFRFNTLNTYRFMSSIINHPPIPLYTHPLKWQGLTENEIFEVIDVNFDTLGDYKLFASAIENKLKEKNS